MKVNPVYSKDSKINNRSLKMIVIMVAYNCVLLIIGFSFTLSETTDLATNGYLNYSSMLELYILFATVEIATLLLLTPALTAGTISGERDRQTLDMLLATRMRPFQILLGKLLSSLDILLTLVLSAMPVMAMVFLFGGIRVLAIFRMQILLVLLAFTVGSAGVFFSTICRRTTVATIVSYIYTVLITVGTFCITYGVNYLIGSSQTRTAGFLGRNIGYILLINPIMSFYVLINEQVGTGNAVQSAISMFGGNYERNFITIHWLGFSLIVQLTVTMLLLFIAAYVLEPIRPELPEWLKGRRD